MTDITISEPFSMKVELLGGQIHATVSPLSDVPDVEKDPRSARAKAFDNGSGKIDGMSLTYWPMKETRFQLVDFDIFTEDESQNETKAIIHVFKRVMVAGKEELLPARVRCYLAWPIDSAGNPDSLESWQLPGNVNVPYEHIITNGFAPPKKGPLAIFIGNDQGGIDSDVAGGLGLPNNRHVSFNLVFAERPQ
jgi:hypothetical protein